MASSLFSERLWNHYKGITSQSHWTEVFKQGWLLSWQQYTLLCFICICLISIKSWHKIHLLIWKVTAQFHRIFHLLSLQNIFYSTFIFLHAYITHMESIKMHSNNPATFLPPFYFINFTFSSKSFSCCKFFSHLISFFFNF